jgi:hypothetical protein
MVGRFSLGKISIGIVLTAITENNKSPTKITRMVIGLFSAVRTMLIILGFE